jgi:hypothetical protein
MILKCIIDNQEQLTPLCSRDQSRHQLNLLVKICYTLEFVYLYGDGLLIHYKVWRFIVFSDQIIHETDEQDTSEVNQVFGVCSQQFPLQRIGSRRVRALPSAQENNETVSNIPII